jgi:5-exo-hydroxycamphor dehydrogenase
MRSGRKVVFTGSGRPLEVHVDDVPPAGPGSMLIRTVLGGVCGTDAHRLAGDLPDPGRPVCFGHEGVGRIEELGAGRTTDSAGQPLAPGDLVYWTPSGRVPSAVPDTGWPPPADVPNPATYQDYATLGPENCCYRIPADTSPEAVIAFGCAMPTALGGMTRLGGLHAGQSVVVQGCGPVGLSATLLASIADAARVIVIGAPAERLTAATRLGASTVIALETTTPEERRAQVLELTAGRGADVVVEATGQIEAFREGMSLLADSGRYLVLGIYSGPRTAPLDVVELNNRSLAVIGSMGPADFEDYRTTIDLAGRYGTARGFRDLITHRFPLARTEDAIGAVGRGDAIKAVVDPILG